MGLVYRPDHPAANGNGMVPSHLAGEVIKARSNLPFPMVMSDQIDAVQSMVDGKWYESKAALRSTYKPSGNAKGERYVEVGDEWLRNEPKPPRPKSNKKAIKDSVGRAFNRVGVSL